MYVQYKCHHYVYVLVITHIHCDRPAEKIWDAVDNFRFLRKSLSGDRVNQTGMNGRGTVSLLHAKANDLTSLDLDHTDSQISPHVLFTKHNIKYSKPSFLQCKCSRTPFSRQRNSHACFRPEHQACCRV